MQQDFTQTQIFERIARSRDSGFGLLCTARENGGTFWVTVCLFGTLAPIPIHVCQITICKWMGEELCWQTSRPLNGTYLLLHRHYIMQITTMKEVKSGERQKGTDRWEMWFPATSICCINHITEGLEHKRTYALWQPRLRFPCSPLPDGIPRPPERLPRPPSALAFASLSLRPSRPRPVTDSASSEVIAYGGVDSHLRSAPLDLSRTTVPPPRHHGGAAKHTGTNNFWHTAVWVLIDYLLFRRRWLALD